MGCGETNGNTVRGLTVQDHRAAIGVNKWNDARVKMQVPITKDTGKVKPNPESIFGL